MIPVFQTVPGPRGNCYAACLASILETSLGEVPDRSDSVDEVQWYEDIYYWLESCGWRSTLRGGIEGPPSGYAIASVRVHDHSIHAVVCLDGQIVHDPAGRPFARPVDPVVLWTVLAPITEPVSRPSGRPSSRS